MANKLEESYTDLTIPTLDMIGKLEPYIHKDKKFISFGSDIGLTQLRKMTVQDRNELHRQHLVQTLESLQYSKTLKPPNINTI